MFLNYFQRPIAIQLYFALDTPVPELEPKFLSILKLLTVGLTKDVAVYTFSS